MCIPASSCQAKAKKKAQEKEQRQKQREDNPRKLTVPKIKDIPFQDDDPPVVKELPQLPKERRVPVVSWDPDMDLLAELGDLDGGWILRPKKGKSFVKHIVPCQLGNQISGV